MVSRKVSSSRAMLVHCLARGIAAAAGEEGTDDMDVWTRAQDERMACSLARSQTAIDRRARIRRFFPLLCAGALANSRGVCFVSENAPKKNHKDNLKKLCALKKLY